MGKENWSYTLMDNLTTYSDDEGPLCEECFEIAEKEVLHESKFTLL